MKKNNSLILSVMCYIVVFIMIQFGISLVALYLDDSIKHPASASPTALSLSSAVASIVIIGLFLWRKWAPISRHYLQQHPWGVLVWTILAALGAILPLQWIYEQLNITVADNVKQLFDNILGSRWGYLAQRKVAPTTPQSVVEQLFYVVGNGDVELLVYPL